MLRITTPNKAPDLHGAGKDGFKDGNLVGGIKATEFNAQFSNGVQEEILSLIEAAGTAPAAANNQALRAVCSLAGANTTTITAALSPFALNADHAGLVLIDASAGNVVVNLPRANLLANLSVQYEFVRTDAAGTVVIINRAAGDLIDGSPSMFLTGQLASRSLRNDGAFFWAAVGVALATAAEAQAWSNNSKVITPLQLAQASMGANQSLTPVGYQRLPGGLILQWGSFTQGSSGPTPIVYPISFPTAVLSAAVTANAGASAFGRFATFNGVNLSNAIGGVYSDQSTYASGIAAAWIALGY